MTQTPALPVDAGFVARAGSVLGIPEFRYLWGGSFAWYAARWIDIVTTGYLALELTGSPLFLSIVVSCRFVPMLVLGLAGGVLVDRFPSRTLLIITVVGSGITCAFLSILAFTGQLEAWHLIASTLGINIVWSLFFPLQRKLIGDVVGGRGNTTTAFALEHFGFVGANLVFSAIAGFLIAAIGPWSAYLLAVAANVVSLLLVARIHPPAEERDASLAQAGAMSYRSVMAVPVIAGVFVISVVMNGLPLPMFQLMPLVARDMLHVGPTELGLLLSANGGGALLGSTILFALAPRRSGFFFVLGTAGMTLCMFLFTFAGQFPLALTLALLAGVLGALFGTFQSSMLVESVGPAGRAKSMGLLTVAIGMQPVGLLGAGVLANAVGAANAFRIIVGGSVVLVLLVFVLFPSLYRHASHAATGKDAA